MPLLEPLCPHLIDRARALVVSRNRASISLVQRHLRCGYGIAARLLDHLEQDGAIGPMDRDGTRPVLIIPLFPV